MKRYVGVNWPEIQADHSPPTNVEVRNAWRNFGVVIQIQILDEWSGQRKQTENGPQT
jgi:hypothetical protein